MAAGESALELLDPEAFEPRPESDIGRRRPLRLQRSEPLDRARQRQLLAPKQELAREQRAVELPQAQHSFVTKP